jgi:hypothetical protein
MCEGSLYDAEFAALAITQARGDLIEAIFLLRAFRTTLPRLGYSEPMDTSAMRIRRRISATYKDLPGGQILGPTFDYTPRFARPRRSGWRRRHAARDDDHGAAAGDDAASAQGAQRKGNRSTRQGLCETVLEWVPECSRIRALIRLGARSKAWRALMGLMRKSSVRLTLSYGPATIAYVPLLSDVSLSFRF